jgi:hypothetical protein
MTIAQPNREAQLTRVLRLLFLAIAITGIISIFFYNRMVAARTLSRSAAETVESLRLANADLKNQYYVLLDNKNLLAAADSLGYVREASPKYLRLSVGQAEVDSPVAITR